MKVLSVLFYFLMGLILINALILTVMGSVWLMNFFIEDWFGVDIVGGLIERVRGNSKNTEA